MAGSGVSRATDSPRVATLPNNSSLKQNASHTHTQTIRASVGSEAVDLLDLTWNKSRKRRGATEEDDEIRGVGRETKNKDKTHTVSRSIGSEEELGIEPQYCLSPVSKTVKHQKIQQSNSKSCLL